MRRPRFWNDTSLLTNVLTPMGLIHNFISKQSYKVKKPYYSKAPVICIGSLIIGGGAKTPVVIAIQKLLLKLSQKRQKGIPNFLKMSLKKIFIEIFCLNKVF